jgi:hypothetical protein
MRKIHILKKALKVSMKIEARQKWHCHPITIVTCMIMQETIVVSYTKV